MSENIKLLSVDSIDGGYFMRKFNDALQEAGADCIERPRSTKARRVIGIVELIPKPIGDTERIHIRIIDKVNTKKPEAQATENIGFVRGGKIFIDVFNPAEPFQSTFDLTEEELNP